MTNTSVETFEDLMLFGITKESYENLQKISNKTPEQIFILLATFIDILEYEKAVDLLTTFSTSVPIKENLNTLMKVYFENKLLLIKSEFPVILENVKLYSIKQFEELSNPREKSLIFLILFVRAEALFRSGNYKDSVSLVKSIIEILDVNKEKISISPQVIYGLYYRILFMNYFYTGELDKANEIVFKGLDIYQKTNNPIYQAFFYNFVGIISAVKGNLVKAEESFQTSIKYFNSIAESSDDVYSVKYTAGIYNNISIIFYQQGRVKEAIEIIKRSLEIYEALQFHIEIANCWNSLGIYYRDLRDYELAEAYLFKSYYRRKKFNDPYEISESLVNITILEERIGKLQTDCIGIKEFPTEYTSKMVDANRLLIEGLVEFSQKNFPKALEKFNLASEMDGVDFSIRIFILDYKAEIFLETDDFKNLNDLLSFWIILAKENNLIPSLFKAYLINFRFELLFLNFNSAQRLIQEASDIAKNFSVGAQKLVERNIDLLNQRKKNFKDIENKSTSISSERTKKEELKELKVYLKEINSLLTRFQELV